MLFRQMIMKFDPEPPKLEPAISLCIKEDDIKQPRKKGCKCIQ